MTRNSRRTARRRRARRATRSRTRSRRLPATRARDGRERLLDRPAVSTDSIVQCSAVHSEASGPVVDTHRLSVVGDETVLSGVPGLIVRRGPTAVSMSIRTIVVDSFQRATLWTRSHVCEELVERIDPRLRHGDASSAVLREPWILRVGAALLGGRPTGVLRRRSAHRRIAVPKLQRRRCFTPQAAARSRDATLQVAQQGCRLSAALASTAHAAMSRVVLRRFADYGKATEGLSEYIDARRHVRNYTEFISIPVMVRA